jgi:membrane associated rhomboid family serine protease
MSDNRLAALAGRATLVVEYPVSGGSVVLIVPLGHENSIARRWPWITTLVVILNACIFLGFLSSDQRVDMELSRLTTQALEHYSEHPGLKLRSPLGEWAPELEGAQQPPGSEATEPDAEAQVELDGYIREIESVRQGLSAWRYGYHASRGPSVGLLTHQFVHGGWLHLLFNLWFLWLVGCNVEDAWGRLLFPIFYLSGGAFGGLMHGWMTGPNSLLLIGASGAVAAAMGAFLVSFARTKIRFFALLLLRPVTFSAPAYVMLPLWAGVELLGGLTQAGAGVAHWAHVGGFGFGVAFAVGLRLSGADKQIEAGIEERCGVRGGPRAGSSERRHRCGQGDRSDRHALRAVHPAYGFGAGLLRVVARAAGRRRRGRGLQDQAAMDRVVPAEALGGRSVEPVRRAQR